jgi:hypothetical protein
MAALDRTNGTDRALERNMVVRRKPFDVPEHSVHND